MPLVRVRVLHTTPVVIIIRTTRLPIEPNLRMPQPVVAILPVLVLKVVVEQISAFPNDFVTGISHLIIIDADRDTDSKQLFAYIFELGHFPLVARQTHNFFRTTCPHQIFVGVVSVSYTKVHVCTATGLA